MAQRTAAEANIAEPDVKTPELDVPAAPVSAPPQAVEPVEQPPVAAAAPPAPTEVASAPPDEPAPAPEASSQAAVADHTAVTAQPDQQMDERPRQVRTIPLYHGGEPSAQADATGSLPAATDANLPDWGDEKKLVEALRADWKEKPVTRTFQRGDEVPADIPLQPLPKPFASRDAGVNMHYLISNGDAVLVLPGMRVVVDVYHSSTASLAGR